MMEATSVTRKGQVTIPTASGGSGRSGSRFTGEAMIGLETNVLASYYIDDASDAQAKKQSLAARRLIESGHGGLGNRLVVAAP